jgi:hypothetical protein
LLPDCPSLNALRNTDKWTRRLASSTVTSGHTPRDQVRFAEDFSGSIERREENMSQIGLPA